MFQIPAPVDLETMLPFKLQKDFGHREMRVLLHSPSAVSDHDLAYTTRPSPKRSQPLLASRYNEGSDRLENSHRKTNGETSVQWF
jgi:hypothetical protein